MRRYIGLGQLLDIVFFLSALPALGYGLSSSCLSSPGHKKVAVTPGVTSTFKTEKRRKRKRGLGNFLCLTDQSWVIWPPLNAKETRKSCSYFYSL